MRSIKYTSRFKKDLRRELKGKRGAQMREVLKALIPMLQADQILPAHHFDHALSGVWKDCRDLHVLPDLILIYRKLGDDSLEFVRIGSHSELTL
ncbi:MAG: type II toxin-antitoxin system YafQ family toxin [Leptolyngbya sp.]|nr:type II toxin-antitoxin system YafQ family toxin [Candidatus Melainabacteria bacterium]